jgi:hypothetical protein
LENNLINKLTLDDLTQIEYYGLINQQEWDLSYSLGRIIDKAYSRNWTELTSNKKSLSLYLKKSKLFDDIGIIGNLNKYLRKFENCSNNAIEQAKQIAHITNDSSIKQQAVKVISLYSKPIVYTLEDPNSWEGNREKYGVKNLQGKYRKIISKKQEAEEKESAVEELIGKIDYNQIEKAIQILKQDTLLGDYEKFSFLESDFGFPINPEDSVARDEFLSYYKTKNQYELYELYLTKNGISFMDNNGQFLYSNIYEMLKYDVVDAFVGGGGGRRDNCVYLLIKILELKFKTRLGYSEKLCSSQGIYSCDCTDQAKAWMHFLEERKLVSPDKTEPASISPNK